MDSPPAWIATVREAMADQSERLTLEAIDQDELVDSAYPPPTAISTASATRRIPPSSTTPRNQIWC